MHRRYGALAVTVGLVGAACIGTAAPAHADAEVGFAIETTSDGAAPFSTSEGPGGDTSPSNGVARTFDSISFEVTASAIGATASNERFELTAPAGTRWSALPEECVGAGSSISGRVLACNLGDFTEGAVRSVGVVLHLSGSLRNGDRVSASGILTADGLSEPETATSEVTTVSAAPRYDLAKNSVQPDVAANVLGPNGTPGVRLRYPITVTWNSVVPGQGLLGFERATNTLRFKDDVSAMTGGGTGGPARLFDDGKSACGLNTHEFFPNLPAGRGGGDRAVLDSGRITCTQRAAGGEIDITLTGVDSRLDPSTIPTQSAIGQPIEGGVKPYIVSAYITLWVPTPPTDSSFTARNTFASLQAESVSGQNNFPGTAEPLRNNSADWDISLFAPGGGYKWFGRVAADGTVVNGSAKSGDPYATPGTTLRSHVNMSNQGIGSYRNAILCDVFDNRTQTLTSRPRSTTISANVTGMTKARVEYAPFAFNNPADGRDAKCGDNDGPWFDSVTAVPGGVDAIGKIRAKGDLAAGRRADLFSFVALKDAPTGTRVRDFGQHWFGDSSTVGWVHDKFDPDLSVGGLADSVITVPNLARITQKVVDPNFDADTTPDQTSSAHGGSVVRLALYPTLTNARGDRTPQRLEITADLPAHTTYEIGSASTVPTDVQAFTDADGQQRQRLTWQFASVVPNTPIPSIAYDVRLARVGAPASVVNEARISTPEDTSELRFRSADRGIRIVTAGGIAVEKSSPQAMIVPGDEIQWDLNITNIDTTPISRVDLIDLLPYDGGANGSSFRGTLRLTEPVVPEEGDVIRYSRTAPDRIDSDPAAPSNASGGRTVWCVRGDFGRADCPTTLADVTAVRVTHTGSMQIGDTSTYRVVAATDGPLADDRFRNRFVLRASNLSLPAYSNTVTTTVVSGAVGDHVWSDTNGNGVQDASESGVAGIRVALHGTDDRGASVVRSAVTGERGNYRFDGLRPGTYSVRFTAPTGAEFTTQLIGNSPETDSNVDETGLATTVLRAEHDAAGALTGVTEDLTVDAGLIDQVLGSGFPARGSHVEATEGAPPSGLLAFTGVTTWVGAVGAAAVAILVGIGALWNHRRNAKVKQSIP